MQFKYSFEVVDNDRIPFIDVVITNPDNKKTTSYRALLDSGAYANVFHSDIAKVLGIDLNRIKEQEVFHGVEQREREMKGKPYLVELMVYQKGKSHKFDALVIFSDEISDSGYGLLGRQFFFDQFSEVHFNYTNNKFYLIVNK